MVTTLQKFCTSLYQDMLSFVIMVVKTSNLYYLQHIFPITRSPLFDKFRTNTIGCVVSYFIGAVLLRHGLDEPLPLAWRPWPVRAARASLFWLRNRHQSDSRGKRLRLACETLGPCLHKIWPDALHPPWDLLPPDLADELALLQDRVPLPGTQARELIEQSLKQPIEALFDDF